MTNNNFIFYLGSHIPQWLWRVDFPLFVSHRILKRRTSSYPRATCTWGLDSGGFTELSMYDGWKTGPREYVHAVHRYQSELGSMDFASPQDWMCEPFMIQKTGLTVEQHQQLTVENFCTLREMAPELPFIPVVQGWELDDYHYCIKLYMENGIDLTEFRTVGLGSVCRRQGTEEIGAIVKSCSEQGLSLHGYGVKTRGLAMYSHDLVSADSMAWSLAGRYSQPMEQCRGHKNDANCLEFAKIWRERALNGIN
jgi:hypothetical protein